MADCVSLTLNLIPDGQENVQNGCGEILPSGDDARSSSSPSLKSASSTGSSRIVGIVEQNLEATAKLRQMREHKQKHRKKLLEKLPRLDELKVKR